MTNCRFPFVVNITLSVAVKSPMKLLSVTKSFAFFRPFEMSPTKISFHTENT